MLNNPNISSGLLKTVDVYTVQLIENECWPDKTAGVWWESAWKHCFVLIFLWLLSFHQGKESNNQELSVQIWYVRS